MQVHKQPTSSNERIMLPTKSVEGIDKIEQIYQSTEVCIEGIQKEAYKHVKELVQVHDRTLAILSRIHYMESWEDEHIYRGKVISNLQDLIETTRQILVMVVSFEQGKHMILLNGMVSYSWLRKCLNISPENLFDSKE